MIYQIIGVKKMSRPLFDTWKPKCSECGAERTKEMNKDGSCKWYRNLSLIHI